MATGIPASPFRHRPTTPAFGVMGADSAIGRIGTGTFCAYEEGSPGLMDPPCMFICCSTRSQKAPAEWTFLRFPWNSQAHLHMLGEGFGGPLILPPVLNPAEEEHTSSLPLCWKKIPPHPDPRGHTFRGPQLYCVGAASRMSVSQHDASYLNHCSRVCTTGYEGPPQLHFPSRLKSFCGS